MISLERKLSPSTISFSQVEAISADGIPLAKYKAELEKSLPRSLSGKTFHPFSFVSSLSLNCTSLFVQLSHRYDTHFIVHKWRPPLAKWILALANWILTHKDINTPDEKGEWIF